MYNNVDWMKLKQKYTKFILLYTCQAPASASRSVKKESLLHLLSLKENVDDDELPLEEEIKGTLKRRHCTTGVLNRPLL